MKYTEVTKENLSIVSDSSTIGIQWNAGGRSTIVETDRQFVGLGRSFNLASTWGKSNKRLYCDTVLNHSSSAHKVLLFDEPRDLFTWLAKGEFKYGK